MTATVHDSMLTGSKPGAADSWAKTKAALDGQAREWLTARVATCEDTRKGAVKEAIIGARLVCLDDRLAELHALTDLLSKEPGLVEEGARASASLTPIAACGTTGARRVVLPPVDAAMGVEVAALRRKLRDVEARRLAGQAKQARPAARARSCAICATRAWASRSSLARELPTAS